MWRLYARPLPDGTWLLVAERVSDLQRLHIRAHTPTGTPARIHLQRVTMGGRDRIVLRVADDGPGVPPALRDKVFDRFFRVDLARVHREGTGTGLGLSIVAAIVTGHGGDIRVEPTDTGFTIRISLPAADHTTKSTH